jgi:hypothetical protein
MEVRILDTAGRHVRSLRPASTGRVDWDLRDDTGRSVAAGVYWMHLQARDGTSTARAVVVAR